LKFNFRTLFLVVLSLLLPAAIAAQTNRASVRGTVHDAQQAVIPEAKVSATNTATGERRTVTADSEGNYAITSLPAGS
jgi:predicted aspartyl protease